MSGSPRSGGDPVVSALLAEVDAARGGDARAPVTVVAPSEAAARGIVPALEGGGGPDGRRGTAGVDVVSVGALVRRLGTPALGAQGLEPAPAAVALAALRREAVGGGGWLADLAAHRRGLVALRASCSELRRCPAPTLEAFGRRHGRVGELARLVTAVRRRLRAGGFADEVDLAAAAEAAAAGPDARALGPLVLLAPGPPAPPVRRVLDAVGSANGTRTVEAAAPVALTEVRACADPGEEASTAARLVAAAVDGGAPPWGQAVLHPPHPFYGRALDQELRAAGLTVDAPGLRRLDGCAAGRAIGGLLALAGSDWPRAEVTAWMAGVPLVHGPGRDPVPAARWDALSAEAGVVAGPGQWAQRLGDLAGRDRRRGDGRRAEESEALAAFVAGLAGATAPPAAPTWEAHARWAVGLLDMVTDAGDRSWPRSEADAARHLRATVASLGQLDRVSDAVDVEGFRTVLGAVLADTPLEPGPPAGGGTGVLVAPFGAARGLRLDDVVLVGMADAVVPGAVAGELGDDPLLPEGVRRLDVSGGLRTRGARLGELHDDVRAAVAAGRGRRLATHPRVDPRTGDTQARSRWIAALVLPATRWRSSDSFAAALTGAGPPLSAPELALRTLVRRPGHDRGTAVAAWAGATPRLRRGVDLLRARGSSSFTPFDGHVGPGRLSLCSPDEPVSATRLETYVKCPRRFLYERVLAVSPRPVPETRWRMDPADRGTLVHAVLEEYVRRRLEGAPRSLDGLLAVAEARFEEAERAGRAGRPVPWRIDRAVVRRELVRFHREEGDLAPLAAELAFGSADDGAAPPVPVALGDGRVVWFKGSADRVDRAPSGELVVSDYKTGRQRQLADLRRDPVAGGRLLQLPVYALAAQARFGEDEPVRARYWLLSEQRPAPTYELEMDPPTRARFGEVVGRIADAVEAGVFPGAPSDRPADRQFDGCRFCDLDRLCPPTRRLAWARKEGAPELDPVRALAGAAGGATDDDAGGVAGGGGGGEAVGGEGAAGGVPRALLELPGVVVDVAGAVTEPPVPGPPAEPGGRR